MNELNEHDALRTDVYQLLARLVREAPDAALLEWLAGLEVERDGSLLAERWASLVAAAGHADAEILARSHFRHLVGVVQGDITPYASWYRNGELMDAALVELRRDLKRLGFQRAEHSRDPEDHLAALCEVMAMLIESRSPDEARFFMAHLAPWAAQCLADLGQVDTPFHAHLGRFGQAFIEEESRHLEAEALASPVRIVQP
ncbi:MULTISPECIES: TorD/DmsD family molecular chaperone [Halomonas]|uniref:TorA maturation chaperone TorD n=1 Tax=Halomonas ventosae TaxID=229007 RepID=A0A4R6HXG2_9GAMM|nr:molecular chaperone TorD family protein [Halomonas ventosae]TDO13812.1 TorA maturation chaperone TorD [Halomonas ventosae]